MPLAMAAPPRGLAFMWVTEWALFHRCKCGRKPPGANQPRLPLQLAQAIRFSSPLHGPLSLEPSDANHSRSSTHLASPLLISPVHTELAPGARTRGLPATHKHTGSGLAQHLRRPNQEHAFDSPLPHLGDCRVPARADTRSKQDKKEGLARGQGIV